MKRITQAAPTAVLALALLLSACGSASSSAPSEADVSDALTQAITENGQGRVTGVSCNHDSGRVYTCLGTFHPSSAGIRKQYRGVHMTPTDIAQLVRMGTGPATWRVTVSETDGSIIYQPE